MIRRFKWAQVDRAFLRCAVVIGVAAAIIFSVGGIVHGQDNPVSHPLASFQNTPFFDGTTTNPWFWICIGSAAFSCLVSGMPEPEKTDSKFYIWAYRSFHLMAANGTAYFQHRDLWPSVEQSAALTAARVASATAAIAVTTTQGPGHE